MKKVFTIIVLLVLGLGNFAYCQSDSCICNVKNASYTGLYKGAENNITAEDLFLDLRCARKFRMEKYPNGFVTICGSSRISEKNHGKDSIMNIENDKLYNDIREFSFKWTKKHSKQYPVMTGAGPGIMEAAGRGAIYAGGPSIGYSTYYGSSRVLPNGSPDSVFWRYKGKDNIITDGLIFTSVVAREYMMIMHSAAIVFAPGGTGTEWEFFQTIEKLKSKQLNSIPVFLFGDKDLYWKSLINRLDDMAKEGTINSDEVYKRIVFINNVDELIRQLEKQLMQ